MNKDIPISKLYINNKLEYDLKVEDNKEKVQQILTKYTINELVEYHIEAVDRINKAIEYMENDMPYLEEPDEEIERCDGTIYMTTKEYDKNILLNILRGDDNEDR